MKALRRGSLEKQTPVVSDIRVLTRADLNVLLIKRPPTQLQTLRDSHHRIARAIACGLGNQEVASICGISLNRVSMLKADPAFNELIAHYRGIVTAEYIKSAEPVIEFLSSVRSKSLAMIEDKLDDAVEKGEFLPSRDLVAFAELGLDRTGYGKVNRNVNVNVDFAADLEAARNRSATARVIEATSAPDSQPVPEVLDREPAPNLRPPDSVQASRSFRRV